MFIGHRYDKKSLPKAVSTRRIGMMATQLKQAIKILQLSLVELKEVVLKELEDRCWCGQKHGQAFADAEGRLHTRARKP
jgi:DNA-directed RNA polymerase specialized sigma54-like protein